MRLILKTLALAILILSVSAQECPSSCTTSDNNCNDQTLVGCNTACLDRTCSSTTFVDSTVSCQGDRSYSQSCQRSTFNQSTVELRTNAKCTYCEFWFSAVTANEENSLLQSDGYNAPLFGLCSCCDGDLCPSNVPECANGAFCSDDHLYRTCKDWGNPACENVAVGTIDVPLKADASTYSEGIDVVSCQETNSCEDLVADGCTILCGPRACTDGKFDNSVVGCFNTGESCKNAVFNHSVVDVRDADCRSCTFWFSAVTTNGPFSDRSYSQPNFWFCSCCDDTTGQGGCPDGVPSCTEDAVGFCSQETYFRSCKAWGNPICNNVDIGVPSGQSKYNADVCSAGVETLWCPDRDDCPNLQIANCTAICGVGACDNGIFEQSMVSCNAEEGYQDSCEGSVFQRSFVDLNHAQCDKCSFFFSAVTTNGPITGSFYNKADFGFCTCCDDVGSDGNNNCPPGVPKCSDDPQEFCSTVHLGRTCKDWGNPFCEDIEIGPLEGISAANAINVTNHNGTLTCSLTGEDAMAVCAGTECSTATATNCFVECYGESCANMKFYDSGVGCLGEDTCATSSFYRSSVDCALSECENSEFFSSALHCGSDSGNCDGVILSRCSCCSGANCPAGALSCDEEDPLKFCNNSFAGRTCADWDHPKCKGVDLPSLPPFKPAVTCNLREDIKICDDGVEGCLGLDSNNCTVLCSGPVCNRAAFADSIVACSDRPEAGWFTIYPGEACVSASFARSIVTCQNSCVGTTFQTSHVSCVGQAGCPDLASAFDACSCCDGPQCPFGIPQCEGNYDAICSTTVNGETCACRGFPACGEEYLINCPGASSSIEKRSGHGVFAAKNGDITFWP